MKIRTIFTIHIVLSCFVGLAQQVPTANNPVNGGHANMDFWSRAGNLNSGNNLFGTKWNSPIYTITGNNFGSQSYRMKINAIFTSAVTQYTINSIYGWNQGVNTTGYVLIGHNNNSMTDGSSIYSQKGAFSLLHLNGEGSVFQEYGYRPWMKTGITLTGNKDLSYFGIRKLSTNVSEEDISETVLLWSDNTNSTDGPDKLVFRFSGFGGSDGTSVSSNRLSNTDLDALHVAQFTGTGLMGLGNTFGTNATGMTAANYIEPQSLQHMSYDWRSGTAFQPYGFMQVTYRMDGTNIPGTGESQNDGLRFGIDNNLFSTAGTQHLNAYLRWQENSPLIIQTDWDNTPGGIGNGERMRIYSTGGPGVPSTMMNLTNTTRIAINYLGSQPITQPRSLLHLGTNINSPAYENWMDYGLLTSTTTRTLFTGITPTNYSDANQPVIGFGGSDLVIIEAGDAEVVRFVRNSNYVGIGDFSPTGPNTAPANQIDAKLDIDGDLRIRTVNQNNDLSQVLVIDPDDHNRVYWKEMSISQNGFGACDDTSNSTSLQTNSKLNLNNNNLYFDVTDPYSVNNNVGFGHSCGTALKAKVDVYQLGISGIGGSFFVLNDYQNPGQNLAPTAVRANVNGNGNGTAGYIGVHTSASASNSPFSYGIWSTSGGAAVNRAGYFTGDIETTTLLIQSDQKFKNNIDGIESAIELISQVSPKTYHYDTLNYEQFNFGQNLNYGFIAQELENVIPELVKSGYYPPVTDSSGNIIREGVEYKAVNYIGLIPILTKGIQEQQRTIEELKTENEALATTVNNLNDRLTQLENCLSNILPQLCQINHSMIQKNSQTTQQVLEQIINVELSDAEHIVLNQNVPNPFAESTVITYSIPESVQKAQIHFYNMNGQLIQTVEVTSRGNGRINVFGSDLSSGTYMYTLVADGKIIDTKRMVKM